MPAILQASSTIDRPTLRGISLAAIFLLALGVRVFLNAQFQGLASPPDPDVGPDAVYYNRLAESLATGQGYRIESQPNIHYPPGVPLLLAVVYWPAGIDYLWARLWFSAIGALACALTAVAAAKLSGPTIGLLAGTALALYPEHAYWSMHFDPEVPLGLVLVALVLAHLALDEKTTWPRSAAVGVLLGAAALISPRSLLIGPLYVGLLFCFGRITSAALLGKRVVVPAVAALLTLAPWTVRNYLVTGSVILVSSHGGSTLLHGNNPLAFADPAVKGSWYPGPLTDVPGVSETEHLPEAARSQAATRLAIDFLRSLSFGELVELELMKLYRFVAPFMNTPNVTYQWAVAVTWLAVAPFAFLGLAASVADRRAAMLHAVLLSYLAITLVFFGEPRYRATIAPIIFLYAALGAAVLGRRGWLGRFGRAPHPVPASG